MESWREQLYHSELYHHGIMGMRWGIRRYQNPDGTLTAAGRKRLAKLEKKAEKIETKKEKLEIKKTPLRDLQTSNKSNIQIDKKRMKKEIKKRESEHYLKSMTDSELKSLIERSKLENEYRTLNNMQTASGTKSLKNEVKNKVVEKSAGLVGYALQKAGEKYIDKKLSTKFNIPMTKEQQAKKKIEEVVKNIRNQKFDNDFYKNIKVNQNKYTGEEIDEIKKRVEALNQIYNYGNKK